jgi:error-prone DNA polymerase
MVVTVLLLLLPLHNNTRKGIRDVAKAMGLSVDAINHLSDSVGSIGEFPEETFAAKRFAEQGFDTSDKHLRKVLEMTRQYIRFSKTTGSAYRRICNHPWKAD